MNAIEAANGRWPDLLAHFCGLTPDQLANKHQPCPLCGGKDRYRFDDKDGTGSWYCGKCGGKDQTGGGGTGMDLLMRHQGLTYVEACQRIEQHLGIAKPIPEPPLPRGKQFWQYNSTFYVVRKDKPDGGKDILPLIWDGTAWKWKAPPAPRPLYGKRQLALKPDAPVLVVEGEKTADAAALLYPSAVVITWPSGCKAFDKADWSPLAGRRCVLWPDADYAGREAMAKLAIRLLKAGATQVRIVHPPADVVEGWDLADADWSVAAAAAYLKHNRSAPIQLPELAPEPEPEPVVEPEPLPDGNDYFTCLGFDHDAFYYQPHSTGQVTRLSRSAHTGTNLCAIAPLAYWESLYPSKTGANWTAAASSLFERQAAAGIYSPDRIRGRGAWWDQKQSVLHLGDRLVLSDREVSVSAGITGSRYLYQRLGSLRGPGKAVPLADQDAFVLLELAGRFKWEVPASGLLIAGWAALAPICGALDWRPHIWLTAGAGSGKSAILDRYIGPLLGDLALHVAGNTSEAGLRQTLRADALPVVFDEAESNERPDQQRMQSVLSLARVASSESRAQTIKGSAEGDAQRYTIRSMFLMSSIATALKQGADKSRFAQLTLRNPNEFAKDERLAHWEALDRDLDRCVTEQVGQRLQARTISLIPVIRQSVKVFTRAAAEAFDSQRLGDQYGTLLAGAWSLQSSEVATRDQAFALIDQNDWESYSQTTEVPDEKRCLQRILQHQIRVEADKVITRTIGELVERALGYSSDLAVTKELAEATLGRNGIRADDSCVVISNTAEAIAAILSDTPWSNCWSTVLARLPGATKPGVTRFKGVTGASRAVSIPISEA
jgi:putative DNA primase/helicase